MKNSTLTGRLTIMLTILALLSFYSGNAQLSPQLKFQSPVLVAGTDGQIGATYKFSNVNPNIDAYITIENIVGGAVLKDIDNTTTGYNDAWQPTVGGPGTFGSSYIKWNVTFDSIGSTYVFSTLDFSAVDVDGDNVRVREFSGINGGQANYSIPTQVPTLLTITTVSDTDNTYGTDVSDSNLIALGPVINRTAIDTLSQDVRIDYNYTNTSGFKIYLGAQVDNNGNPGAILTDRFHCIYFGNLTGILSVLKVTYQSFTALLNNNAVKLNWTTNAEVTNEHFEIERSFDNTNFSTTAIVLEPQAVDNEIHYYNYSDNDPEILYYDVIYYRLKQADVNGKYTYSDVKTVRTGNTVSKKERLQVKPNPCMNKLSVVFYSKTAGKAEIRMISLSGTVVKKVASSIDKGFNTIQLHDLASHVPGVYVVNIAVNGETIGAQRIIKN